MNTRLYSVTSKEGTTRLIDATSASQALRYVAAETFTVKVPTQKSLVDLLSKGTKVEVVGALADGAKS